MAKRRKKALNKDIRVEIRKSLGRFVSIFLIVALGVSFFSGLRSTENDMRYTGDAFADRSNLMDLRVISTMGLTDDDVNALSQVDGISGVEPGYMKDVLTNQNETDYVVELLSMPDQMNQIQVTEGRLPEAENECLLDNRLKKAFEVEVGDTITFSSGTDAALDEDLTETTYTVTGFGDSPLFIGIERGSSMIGSGQINGFAIVQPTVFTQDYYTQIYLTVDDAYDKIAFTDEYTNAVEPVQERVEALEEERCQARYDEVTEEPRQELADAKTSWQEEKDKADSELADARSQLDDGWKQLNDAKDQLADSRTEYEQNYESTVEQLTQQQEQLDAGKAMMSEEQITQAQEQIDAAYAALDEAKQSLDEAEAQIKENEEELTKQEETYENSKTEVDSKLADTWNEIEDSQKELDDIEVPTWQVINRESLPGYTDYGSNAERMGAIGKVFPALFFLVAALVALTAITRMVEEQRTLIGTYKALGYSKVSIAKKYLVYALSATLGGSIVGVLIGEKLFPIIVIVAYRIMYTSLLTLVIPYNWHYAIMSTALAVLSVTFAAFAACYKELSAQPAVLMRPVAPKPGKRVLLEHIGFIWKHLSFSQKNTFRNLFRYKKRLIMTVFGIGCTTGLMVVGFGLKDSIMNIASLQYENIQLYDAMATLNTDETDKLDDADEKLDEIMTAEAGIDSYAKISMKSMDISADGNVQTAYTVVCNDASKLETMTLFRNRTTKEKYELTDDGVILTEQIAEELGVGEGDTITITSGSNEPVTVVVSHVTENYLMHYVYMTANYYQKVFSEAPEYNMYWLKLTKEGLADEDALGQNLMDHDEILTVTYISSTREMIDSMLSSLYIVIIVLVISASLLAFVVIYNLNNINISERRRELATIKLLGFYDSEVAMYVYRENIWLTILGAFVGIFIGKALHGFIIQTVQVNQVMFGHDISVPSYIYSMVLAFIFSMAVNGVMYFQLKKIDMIESLKSVE